MELTTSCVPCVRFVCISVMTQQYEEQWLHRIRPDQLLMQMSNDAKMTGASWLALIAAIFMMALVPVTEKRYRFIPMFGSGLLASIPGMLAPGILSYDRRRWAHENIEEEVEQDNKYRQMLIPEEKETKKLKSAKPALFDWERLKVTSASSEFKPRMVVATTGDGKTSLMRYLMALMHETTEPVKTYVFSPTWQSGEFPESTIYGAGADFNEIALGVRRVNDEFRERQSKYEHHQYGDVEHYFFDEFRDSLRNVPILSEHYPNWITQMRKLYQVLWIAIHLDSVKAMQMEGEGELRKNFVMIRLGSAAVEFAEDLLRDGKVSEEFVEYVRDMKRPCLVNDVPALIPNVKEAKPVEVKEVEPEDSVVQAVVPDVVQNMNEDAALKFFFNTMKKLSKQMTRSSAIKSVQSLGKQKYAEVKLIFDEAERVHGKLSWNTGDDDDDSSSTSL